MAGRKRIPSHMHIVRGTDRPGRINKNEPKPPAEPPRAPDWLSKRACELFGILTARIQSLGLASSSDTEKVMLAALRYEEIETLTVVIQKEGHTYTSTKPIEGAFDADGKPVLTTLIKTHPAVAMRSEAMRHLQSLLTDFGLCPSSRGKVSVPMSQPTANPWAGLAGS